MLDKIKSELHLSSDVNKAKILQSFFKTKKGEYGEGDVFIGVTVPDIREISKKYYKSISSDKLEKLLSAKIHEERLLALIILVYKFQRCKDETERGKIYNFYMKHIDQVNNWDLVDLTCRDIIGGYLFDEKDKKVLVKLAKSRNLWHRRIAIVSTYYFIKRNQFDMTMQLAILLLKDTHDLIHKAVGWMLREVGKRDQKVEEEFLCKYYKQMPRTMLRYAIEKFDMQKRRLYLCGQM